MSKIVRYEFMGNYLVFWLLFFSGVLMPFAILYLINGTVRIETEIDDPESFIEKFREDK